MARNFLLALFLTTAAVSANPTTTITTSPSETLTLKEAKPIWPILPRMDRLRRRQTAPAPVVVYDDEECDDDEDMSADALAIPVPTTTVTLCPGENCHSTARPVPSGQVCPPEQCPECSPEVCTPCPADGACPVCDASDSSCLPACADYCPPAADLQAAILLATPTPTPTPDCVDCVTPISSPVATSHTVTLPPSPEETTSEVVVRPSTTTTPTAAAYKSAPAPGVYMGMAAVFVAVVLF